MAGPVNNNVTFTTVQTIWNNRKWLMYEKGLMALWNEMNVYFASALEGGATMPTTPAAATLGACDKVSNLVPDFAFLINQSGQSGAPPTQSR